MYQSSSDQNSFKFSLLFWLWVLTLPILTLRNEIENAQRQFVAKLEERCNRQIPAKVGYKGGYEECVIRWSQVLGLWFNSGRIVENRYWNPFGLSEVAPRENSMLSIVCEINPPVEGLNKQAQGAFMRDENGHIWLLHRGKIGGGKPGIGRKLFYENYRGETMETAGERFAVVGDIDSSDFVDHVTSFVREVERIKALAA
jgi:hypothetical protein